LPRPTASIREERPWHDRIEFEIGRRKFNGYLAVPEGGDAPGILLIHAWWGLTGFFKSVCDRLADEGFVALAPDLYHGKTASTIAEAKRLRSQMKRAIVAEELEGAVDLLSTLFAVSGERIGVLGFSLGAYWAMWLATQRPREVAAVTTFYGTRKGDYRKARAAFLGHFAEDDKFEPLKSVRFVEAQMRSARREATFHLYPNTRHWFFEKDRSDAYDPKSAKLAWKRTIAFFHEKFDH
jgi:carboxymethylenebutenolidase